MVFFSSSEGKICFLYHYIILSHCCNMPWENKPPLSISFVLKLISDPKSKSELCNLSDTLQANENLIFIKMFT